MPHYQVLYWQDIPAQLKILREDARPRSILLKGAMERIDAVAMRLGLAETEEYLNQWKWSERYELNETVEMLEARLTLEITAPREGEQEVKLDSN